MVVTGGIVTAIRRCLQLRMKCAIAARVIQLEPANVLNLTGNSSFDTSTFHRLEVKEHKINLPVIRAENVTETSTGSAEMILADLEGLSDMLKIQSNNNGSCVLWAEETTYVDYFTSIFRKLKLREEDVFCDVTLLVGPDEKPMKAHRVILCAYFEYFRKIFCGGLEESLQGEVRLPYIDPESFKLILDYAYNGKAAFTKENVLQIFVLAKYLVCEPMIHQCCNFIRRLINVDNCVKLLLFALKYDIAPLKEDTQLFIIDHFEEVHKTNLDFTELPVDLMIELVQHPAVVISEDPAENEKQLFTLLWRKMAPLSDEDQKEFIPKLLESVHLPQVSAEFLTYIEKKVGHIEETKDLIEEARKEVDVLERREWYLPRYKSEARVEIKIHHAKLQIGDTETGQYSPCVLIKGFSWFVYVNSGNRVFIKSPVAIEKLSLLEQVIARFEFLSGGTSCYNTYYKGKTTVDGCRFRNTAVGKLQIRFERP